MNNFIQNTFITNTIQYNLNFFSESVRDINNNTYTQYNNNNKTEINIRILALFMFIHLFKTVW